MTTRWAGDTARERLRDAGEFTLHSAFDSSVNLVGTTGPGDSLVHFSAHRTPNPLCVPFGVEVDEPAWTAWSSSRPSRPARWFWQPRTGRFTSRVAGVADLVLGADWREAPGTSTAPVMNAAYPGLGWPSPRLRAVVLATCGLASTTGLARRARTCVTGMLHGRSAETSWFLGRGPGLTPSGDDILIGILAALRMWGMPGDSPLAVAHLESTITLKGPELTTDISLAYLRDACTGRFAGPTLRLLYALRSNDSSDITAAVGGLRTVGHTSGHDTLLGAITTMDVLVESAESPPATVTS